MLCAVSKEALTMQQDALSISKQKEGQQNGSLVTISSGAALHCTDHSMVHKQMQALLWQRAKRKLIQS